MFSTRSGNLIVKKDGKGLSMDFPASMPEVIQPPDALIAGLGREPQKVLAAFDYIAVFDSEDEIRSLHPDFSKWLGLDLRGVVTTAPGNEVDFVSRCFFPKLRVNEDPVTGSSHCELAPYWGKRLGLKNLRAKQLSKRTGLVECALVEDRVILSGTAVSYMQGQIII